MIGRVTGRILGEGPTAATGTPTDVALFVPDTAVYAKNLAAIDRFLGQPPRSLTGVETIGREDVPDRYAPLLARLDATFDAAKIRDKKRDVLLRERWFGRSYATVSYTFGNEASARRRNKPALLVVAGIHGDEAGGVLGAADVLAALAGEDGARWLELAEPIVVVPSVHPATLDLGVRELLDGRDPNRLFYTDDPTRPASVRVLEEIAEHLTSGGRDALIVDFHQDDRYAADAVYALYANERSRAVARAAIEGAGAAGLRPHLEAVDGVDNDGAVLPKRYPGAFTVPPAVAGCARPPIEITIEANDAAGFLPALEAALTRFDRERRVSV